MCVLSASFASAALPMNAGPGAQTVPSARIMTSLAGEVQLLQQVAQDLQTSRYLTVASFVALAWDILITLQDEISLIWEAGWSPGKVLYIACRYPILMEAVVWLTYTLDFSAGSKFCSVASYLDGWSTLVFIIPVQLIVVLRTIALWDRRRVVVISLIVVTLATDVTMATSIALVSKSLVFEPNPLIQPVFGCDSGLVSLNTRITIPAWAALMGFDTIIFLLTLIKVVNKIRQGRTPLLAVLVRDGFLYYTFMLATSATNLVFYSALPMSRHGLLNSMLQVLRSTMSIIGARILLNARGVIHALQTEVAWSQTDESPNMSYGSSQGTDLSRGGVDSFEFDPPIVDIRRLDT